MKRMYRWICLMLVCVLFVGNIPLDVQAAKKAKTEKTEKTAAAEEETESEKGNMIKLEKAEGTASVKNATGKVLKLREGGRLYNGYQVFTEEGYAWINLDDTKLIKLDWYSSVEIRKDNKKLEVLLDNGRMFFSVDKPLEEDESLDIKTSAMSTGVRGTMGLVTVERKWEVMALEESSQVQLYEGVVGVGYYEEQSGLVTTEIGAGYTVDIEAKRTTNEEVLLAPVSQEQIMEDESLKETLKNTGFVAMEVKDNAVIQERILEGDNDVDEAGLQEIMDHAEEQLRTEQEAMKEEISVQMEKIEQEREILTLEKDFNMVGAVEQVFTEEIVASLPAIEKEQEPLTEVKNPEEPTDTTIVQEETKVEEEKTEEVKPQEPNPALLLPEPPKEAEKLEPIETVILTPEPEPSVEETPKQEESGGNDTIILPTEFTVQYQFDGSDFAIEVVKPAQRATEPMFWPTMNAGQWHDGSNPYQFSEPVVKNLVLNWVEMVLEN